LALTLKSVSLQSKKNVEKILIIGEDLAILYRSIKKVFPNAHYIFSNKSQKILNLFDKNFDSNFSIKTKVLDIFNGSSLTDFYLEFGKFDLIILSGIFSEYNLNTKKKRNSILFLYKHFLNFDGLFSIFDSKKELSEDLINLLKKMRYFRKIIKSYQEESSLLQYLIFIKKNRLKLFGD